MSRRRIAFLLIVMLSAFSSAAALAAPEESKENVLFQLKSGQSVRGDIVYESELHYRIEKSGGVDPMMSGKKVIACFGFCDIRNFTDTTECLEEKVMVFVNEIAEIIHS